MGSRWIFPQQALAQCMVWRFALQIFTKQQKNIRPLEVRKGSRCQKEEIASFDLDYDVAVGLIYPTKSKWVLMFKFNIDVAICCEMEDTLQGYLWP